jgi:hypothetical protein
VEPNPQGGCAWGASRYQLENAIKWAPSPYFLGDHGVDDQAGKRIDLAMARPGLSNAFILGIAVTPADPKIVTAHAQPRFLPNVNNGAVPAATRAG